MEERHARRTALAIFAAWLVVGVAAVVLMYWELWHEAVLRRPPSPIILRVISGMLSFLLTGIAARELVAASGHVRHPRWRRAYAVLLVVWAGWMLIFAFRGH
jgi:hypothetical protein